MKTPWIVIGVCIVLVFAAFLRLSGQEIPSLAIASFSVTALFTSLADLLEVLRLKRRYQTVSLILSMLFFVIALIVWFFPPNLDPKIAQYVGDAFTILGIASVIVIFAVKELKAPVAPITSVSETEAPTEIIDTELEFYMTKHEYAEMLNLNDIIEQLKLIDEETFPYHRVHNGWAMLYDTIVEHWHRGQGPFYDGLNRQMYLDFILKLDHATENISNIADTDPRTYRERNIKMWNENISVTIQPAYYNQHVPTIQQVHTYLTTSLNAWDDIKKQISERFEKSRVTKL
ncbi:hypothetical protein [Paenibacillus sp. OAE614]|uniref:hypothetical protein n=1 Tax=Paenibacillus sp. OAE614 TaxID=2663804 RepID=UPI00178BB1DE